MVNFGQPLTLSFDTFSDAAKTVPADPSTVELDIQFPDGTEAVYTWAGGDVTHMGTGVFIYTFTPTQSGRHAYHWVSTGTAATSSNGEFDVGPKYPTQIVSLDDAKAQLNITRTTYDDELQGFIDAATEIVEFQTGPIRRQTFTEVHNGGGPTIVLDNPPVISVTSVTEYVGPTAYPLTQAELGATTGQYSWSLDDASEGIIARRYSGGLVGNFAAGYRNVSVTYVGGRPQVPANVRLAALLIIEHLWEQTQRGDSSGRPVPGVEPEADVQYGPDKQSQAMALLQAYRRVPGLA